MKKITTFIVIVLVGAFIAFRLYSNKKKNQEEVAIVAQKNAQVAVKTSPVLRQEISGDFIANGNFVASQDLNVAAEIGGQVQKILVKEGDFVTQGQVLAQIKPDRVNVALEQAKQVFQVAQNEVKRFENAYQTGGVTEQQLEQVRLQLKNAQANYNAAKISSSDTSVRSKISGIVSSKNVEEGTVVGAGTSLFNVVNINELKLKVTVDERQVLQLKQGEEVVVKPTALASSVNGKISFIAPKANGAMKFPVEIIVPNSDKILKAGMYAQASFGANSQKRTTLLVPRQAFVGSVSQNKIFKIENGKAILVSVVSGTNFGDEVEIVSGLKAGDQVVISGQINLENGTEIKVIK